VHSGSKSVIEDIGGDNRASGIAQCLHDCTASGCRFPDMLRYPIAFEQDQALDGLGTSEVGVQTPRGFAVGALDRPLWP
jgi:hypothetical protein